MNEVTFKSAESVALYASRLIIATKENDPGCFDIHGTAYGTMQGYQLDGKVLTELLTALNIDYTYFSQSLFQDGKDKRYRCELKNEMLNLIKQNFTIYLGDDDCCHIKQLSIAENGHGGLQIKMSIHFSDLDEEETYERKMSYFGPYSIRWSEPDQTPQE